MSCCFTDSSYKGKKLLRRRKAADADADADSDANPEKAITNTNKNHKSGPQHHPIIADESGPILDELDFGDINLSFPTSRDVDALILQLNDNAEFEWSGGHRLSAILEILEEESRRGSTSTNGLLDIAASNAPKLRTLNRQYHTLSRHLRSPATTNSQSYSRSQTQSNSRTYSKSYSKSRSISNSNSQTSRSKPHILSQKNLIKQQATMSAKGKSTTAIRPIETPPKDLESISRIDASLVFEHFTTEDAWLLGSSLRTRLMPISTPVVINISLANQNQTLFHTCTHSGVMPDNDSWVSRKRKTVLRWGCSTWYMHCKFGGDEVAFAEKYGLGNEAGSYAIHGGGVPIRVSGVEGVVAVVVVSGLKQHEDHAVVVEVIKELYY